MPPGIYAFPCPNCGSRLKTRQELIGRSVRCRHCDQTIRVPRPLEEREVSSKGPRKSAGIPTGWVGADRQRIVEPEGSFDRQRMCAMNVGGNRQQPRRYVSVSRSAVRTASASARGR